MTRILIVKLAAIGDVVMTLPFLRKLRTKHPRARLTWVCGREVAILLQATQLIDELIVIDEKKLLTGSFFSKIAVVLSIWKKIGGRLFDEAFLLNPDPRYRLITLPIFCKRLKRHRPIPGRYHADEYVRLLDEADGARLKESAFPALHIPPREASVGKPIVVLSTARVEARDGKALRRWPIERYVAVAKDLAQEAQIVLTGSPSEAWIASEFAAVDVQNQVGQLDLLQLLCLLQQSALLITHDSGIMHLGKLVGCPTLALFGPTNPAERTTEQEKINVLWGGKNLACRPCYNGKTYAACQRNDCMLSISVVQVVEEARKMLESVMRQAGIET